MRLIPPARQINAAALGFAYLAVLWLWTASSCWREWRMASDNTYGWIVFPLSGYFAWKGFSTKTPDHPLPGWAARWARFGLFFPALLALPLELIRLAPLYWSAGPWTLFLAAAVGTMSLSYLSGGKSWLVASLFPLLLASTAIPWPTFAEYNISIRLTEWTAGIVNQWLHLSGAPSHREGVVIILPNCAIGIERACSGLRSLQASIMTGIVAGEIFGLRPVRRCLLLVLCPYFALLTNLVRTYAIAMIGFRHGGQAATTWHDPSDWLALAAMMLAILALAFALRGRAQKTPDGTLPSPSHLVSSAPIVLAILCFLLPIGLAHSWYWLHRSDGSDLPLLKVGPGTPLEKMSLMPLPPEIQGQLAPSQGNYFRIENSAFGALDGYHFFWKRSRNAVDELYHRPDVCMPGAGWTLIGKPEVLWLDLHGTLLQWHLFTYQREGTKVDVLWGAWLDGRSLRNLPDGSGSLQAQLLWQLILDGIRDTNYEVAAVLITDLDHPLSPAEASEVLSHSFSLNADSAHH